MTEILLRLKARAAHKKGVQLKCRGLFTDVFFSNCIAVKNPLISCPGTAYKTIVTVVGAKTVLS